MKKNSIAKRVTRRVSAIFLVALTVLCVSFYFLVDTIVMNNARSNNESMVKAYADMVLEEAEHYDSPIDENFAEKIWERGNYACEIFKIDFAYLLVPLEDSGKIKYICVSQNERFDELNPSDKYIGKIYEYNLTDDEWAVWRGEKDISHSVTTAKYTYEITTMTLIKDKSGNKIIAGVDQSYEGASKESLNIFIMMAVIIVLVVIGVYVLVYVVIKRRVSNPAVKLSRTMNEYITDGKRSTEKLEIKGNDEFTMMAAAFNTMTDDISSYLENIRNLTHEQEQQNVQLDIASGIQRGFLKNVFFETDGCVIHADMIPAKYVGGDLYDYQPLEDGKFLTVIADVSGKGVSAAIFMAVTLMLIREFAKVGLSPAQILSRVNNTLCENNPSMLFATAIVGIFDSENNSYTYANAGHNLPYIIKNNEVKTLGGAGNTLIGMFENEEYYEETIKLDTGDTLFLYTDGVNEAVNSKKEFFGIPRLEDTLKAFTAAKKENLVDFVNNAVGEFVGNAERHDDITMLCFTVANTKNMVLKAQESEFEKIKNEILALPLPRNNQLELCLAAEEYFINICSYAYQNTENEGYVNCSISVSNRITLRFTDSGMPFDQTSDIIDIEEYDMEEQVGGLGRFIAMNKVDDAKYEYKNNQNILTLTKYF
ncbi:MAG: SpoIIE family protein phosphatase [Clostridiales bacterium]|nr:SpoIIE family protein phosphatase [Candidatus Equinaster intestinalis]